MTFSQCRSPTGGTDFDVTMDPRPRPLDRGLQRAGHDGEWNDTGATSAPIDFLNRASWSRMFPADASDRDDGEIEGKWPNHSDKKRRAILSRQAANLRKDSGLWTRVRVVSTEIVLETRDPKTPGSPWTRQDNR